MGMWRSYCSAAVRDLSRSGIYAVINIVGLAVGFAAAMLIFLFVRDELSYDRFFAGYESVFRISMDYRPSEGKVTLTDFTNHEIAGWLRLNLPEIQAIARIAPDERSIRHGAFEANQLVYWADPDFFTVFPLKAIAGDPGAALARPDGIVLTRSMARKYFGRDTPIGETLELDRQHPMQVMAVLEDLPSRTHLDISVVASGRAAFSSLTALDSQPPRQHISTDVYTYFRLRPGSSVEDVRRQLPRLVSHNASFPSGTLSLPVLAVSEIHLHPAGLGAMKPAGDRRTLYAVCIVGALIVLLATINFVNLMTARASKRAIEVGVRKAFGASRHHLIVQFIGESIAYVALSTLLATAVVELLVPYYNSFLGRSIEFDYWSLSSSTAFAITMMLTVGILAGFYPAFVLSGFRPTKVLKGDVILSGAAGSIRQALVVLQFAILIGLMIVATIIYQQTYYATKTRMRVDGEHLLLIENASSNSFVNAVRTLHGVRAVTRSRGVPMNNFLTQAAFQWAGGQPTIVALSFIDSDFLEFYGFRPLAGRFFTREDGAKAGTGEHPESMPVVINETLLRKLSFAGPEHAINQPLVQSGTADGAQLLIIGVTPDFPVDSVSDEIRPTIYIVDPAQLSLLSVRLVGDEVPQTLDQIDQLWSRWGEPQPIKKTFFETYLQQMYEDITRQWRLFSIFSAVAVLLACLGLFGLSVHAVQRRTKEIGIRKAVGAMSSDILRLLLWQFSQPVIWANLIAWPVAAFFMNRWLHGFAYHIDLEFWVFPMAGLMALTIALVTVISHSFIVARASAITALRHE
jgi:putative ABC transport system permease protein